ncbi:MAG: hypothetical protein RIR46_168 [Actinomycetota bacterium]|jgi:GT2 family glycosyltransferase
MSSQVTAVVVCHDTGDYLTQTLQALSQQTRPADRVILVNTSGKQLDQTFGSAEVIELDSKTKLPAALAAATQTLISSETHWLWMLHDDSAPEPECLASMLSTLETTALVGAIAPKQVDPEHPRIIRQLGLTLTPLGEPLSLVSSELDQSQHDTMSDVMAVSTAGLLVRTDIYEELGGLNPKAPPLAADYDLSLRVRLAGLRVMVVPAARIRHAQLSLEGKRSRAWLRGSPKTAVRKAAVHLRLAFSPLWFALLYWMLLPLVTVARTFWRLFQKRPDRIPAELLGGLWGFFTVAARLSGRAGNSRGIRAIRKSFDAPWSTVRAAGRSQADLEQAQELQKAFALGEHELEATNAGKNFTADRGWLWVALLLAISYANFPTAVAVVSGSVAPLADNWWQVFLRAGSSWQPIGQGFAGPADPFNWALLALSSLTPWAPSLSVGLLLFAAPALAFSGAWRTATLITPKTWIRTAFALGYALWPWFIQARNDASLPTVIAAVTLPWLVFTIARAAGLGRSGSARSMRQTWSWVGVSGLLFALVGVSSPVLAATALIALALVALTRIRRFGYLLWIGLPFSALYTPLAFNLMLTTANPLSLLTEPGVPNSGGITGLSGLLLPVHPSDFMQYGYAVMAVVALLALLTKRWVLASVMWAFALLVVAIAVVHSQTLFANPGGLGELEWVSGSPSTLLIALGLVLLGLVAIAAEYAKPSLRIFVGLTVMLAAIAPMALSAATATRNYTFADDRVVPWLLEADAQIGKNVKVLLLDARSGEYSAKVLPVSGLQLEDNSIAYRYSLAELNRSDSNYKDLAGLVAGLASANDATLAERLNAAHIAYLLVPSANSETAADLINSLDSLTELSSAGNTEFGRLWRVTEAVDSATAEDKSPWSITKLVQLSILVGFILLAVPTNSSRSRKSKTAEIFIENDGDNA